jgi:hypothetical protein
LKLLNEALDLTLSVHRQMGVAISLDNNAELIDNLKEQLLARGESIKCFSFSPGWLEQARLQQSRLPNNSVTSSVRPAT